MPRSKVFLIQMPLAACEPSLALAQLYAFLRQQRLDAEVMDVSVALFHRRRRPGYNLWSEETNTVWAGEELPAQILDQDRGFIESRFLERIVSAPAPVAGFSVTACSFPASLTMARWLKARRPDALVVFGGQIFTTTPSTVRPSWAAAKWTRWRRETASSPWSNSRRAARTAAPGRIVPASSSGMLRDARSPRADGRPWTSTACPSRISLRST